MTHSSAFTQNLFDCQDALLVGGKAANLARLARAGFAVPGGFVINTRAYHCAKSKQPTMESAAEFPADIAEEIRLAYRAMEGGKVAVRSSATAEDMAHASMAGQCETFLGIEGETALLEAVRQCWASLGLSRIDSYCREHGIDPSSVGMAVVVQRMVPADAAGVLFTTSPHHNGHREMLIEATWGLGDSVVSGRVQPDVLRLEQQSGRVIDATISDKAIRTTEEGLGERPVEESRRRQPCLSGRDVHRLWQLGRRVAAHFGSPQDIEWAIHAGEIHVLQSRPITTSQNGEAREEVLHAARSHLRRELAAGHGPWVLHNLAETLPHPTPLTWSVVRRFMSGAGGLGAMYRLAGFEPSPTAKQDGFLDLIAGRIYMDAARLPEMFFADFPFAYDLETLKRSPDASQSPPTIPRGSWWARLKARRRLTTVSAKLRTLSADWDMQLRETLFPDIARYVACAKRLDLRSLSSQRLVELWQEYEEQVLVVFGSQLLLPSLICEMAMSQLRDFLAGHFWDADSDALVRLISSGGPPDRTVSTDAELYDVAQGNGTLEHWLAVHGHRAAGEFDLSTPRWHERPASVGEMVNRLKAGHKPLDRHHHHATQVKQTIETLRLRLPRRDRGELDRRIQLVWRYISLREDSKDWLMLGYDLLRRLALEAGRRLELDPDIFMLSREELLEALHVGFAPYSLIEQRKHAYQAESALALPRLIEPSGIEHLGQPDEQKPEGDSHQAFPISAGRITGPARIRRSLENVGDLGDGYVLVCPSTDPSWTPLFVNAAGLVLECGGTLSHGAIVAREMGLPAVVLPGACQIFHEGQEIQVDGDRGWVGQVSDKVPPPSAEQSEPDDEQIPPERIPPSPGYKDRRATKLRNTFATAWSVYLLAFFLFPVAWLHEPSCRVLDRVLWPMVRAAGKPATVALVAAAMAAAVLILQKLMTDNPRSREAKRRAAMLRHQAKALPKDSPRRSVILRLAAGVQAYTLLTAMVPIGILLGPMVLPLVWFKSRIDPAVWSPPAGSAVRIMAMVESDWSEPVQLDVPSSVLIDEATPASRTLPPIRKTLEHLLALCRQPRNDQNEPWELRQIPRSPREWMADDLQAYLESGIPPRGLTWLIHPSPEMSGRFAVKVVAPGHPPIGVDVVLGEEYPPAPTYTMGQSGSPIQQLRVVYPEPKVRPVFWQPFAQLAGYDHIPLARRLATCELGWLGLYILVYLVALFSIRTVLKVA